MARCRSARCRGVPGGDGDSNRVRLQAPLGSVDGVVLSALSREAWTDEGAMRAARLSHPAPQIDLSDRCAFPVSLFALITPSPPLHSRAIASADVQTLSYEGAQPLGPNRDAAVRRGSRSWFRRVLSSIPTPCRGHRRT